jgi:hypothetical protein
MVGASWFPTDHTTISWPSTITTAFAHLRLPHTCTHYTHSICANCTPTPAAHLYLPDT